MSKNNRYKSNSYGTGKSELRTYEGKCYKGQVVSGHKVVIAFELVNVGEDVPSEGVSFPMTEWGGLPLCNGVIQ